MNELEIVQINHGKINDYIGALFHSNTLLLLQEVFQTKIDMRVVNSGKVIYLPKILCFSIGWGQKYKAESVNKTLHLNFVIIFCFMYFLLLYQEYRGLTIWVASKPCTISKVMNNICMEKLNEKFKAPYQLCFLCQ